MQARHGNLPDTHGAAAIAVVMWEQKGGTGPIATYIATSFMIEATRYERIRSPQILRGTGQVVALHDADALCQQGLARICIGLGGNRGGRVPNDKCIETSRLCVLRGP